jgi:hypothetical protein
MLRDYSADLYLTRSEERTPDACEEVAFVLRAHSIEEATQLAIAALRKEEAWIGWRLFELNAQEIQPVAHRKTDSAGVLSGPTRQALIRKR